MGVILANPDHFCGRGATLWCRNPLLSSNNYVYFGSFNENGVVGNRFKSYRIPWQSGTFYFGGDFGLACFWPIQDIFVVAEPLLDVGASS